MEPEIILELSQRLEELSQPAADPECSFGRPPLAALDPNLQPPNPFGFTHQRNKAARKAGGAAQANVPRSTGRTPPLTAAADAASARPSPTPFVLHRGRLSFGLDGSARKFEPVQTPKVATVAVKRKLTADSPAGDLMLVFPSVKRATACKRRFLSHDDFEPCSSAPFELCGSASGAAAAVSGEPSGGGAEPAEQQQPTQQYWSDPLPLPAGLSLVAAEEDGAAMEDTAASSPPPRALPGNDNGASAGPGSAAAMQLSPFERHASFSFAVQPPLGSPGGAQQGLGPAGDRLGGSQPGCSPGGCCGMETDSPAPSGSCSLWGSADCGAAAVQVPFSPLASGHSSSVPLVDHPDCGLPSITPQTAAELISSGGGAYGFERCVVVDCRYGFEFGGGCIEGACSINTPDDMDRFLAEAPLDWASTALIFHCEFSSERGPRMFRHVREADRRAHVRDYPALSYPHMFVLQGGYKAFHHACPALCGGYLPMDHPDCSAQLKEAHKAVKAAWARTRRSYDEAQRRKGRRYVVRPGSASEPPAVAAAQHAMAD